MAKTTLTGANQQTDWYDLRGISSTACFMLTGDFQDPVGVHYSNNDLANKGTDYTVDPQTYASIANGGPWEVPFGTARFVRFFSAAWTGGKTCIVTWAKVKNVDGTLVDVAVQSTGGLPGVG